MVMGGGHAWSPAQKVNSPAQTPENTGKDFPGAQNEKVRMGAGGVSPHIFTCGYDLLHEANEQK